MKEETVVRLRRTVSRNNRTIARVISRLDPQIKGGVMLDRRLAGFQFWNVKDLQRAREKRVK